MIHMKKLIAGIAVLLSFVACHERKVVLRDTIPYVKQLAADSADTYPLLRSYLAAGTRGSIVIIGEPEASLSLASQFKSVDAVDNIDGKAASDSLPDFSGESFDVVMDLYNAPYIRMASSCPDSLREVAVRNAVMAVDSIAYSNALDASSRLLKSRAKVFVLASSLLDEFGRFDIDTLFWMAGREPVILTPVEAMLDAAKRAGCTRVAVWAPEQARPAYEAAAKDYGMELTVVSTTGNGILRPAFRDMMRIYRTDHPNDVLDAVLLDSFTADLDELYAEQEHIHRQITEADMACDRILAPHFQFIEPKASLTSACYRLLREKNLFTHDIAYPSVRYFQTEENWDGDYVFVEIGANYLFPEKTSSSYVPDID